MNMMSDNRAISDTAYDTATCATPTIGALTLQTLDMQAETMAMINNIASMMWGDECAAPVCEPKESLIARLAAIQENQRAIMATVKAIVDKL